MKPIDFVYDAETGTYDLSPYATDDDLLARVQQGLTERQIYRISNDIVPIDKVFSATSPREPEQDQETGQNNLQAAEITVQYYPYTNQMAISKK